MIRHVVACWALVVATGGLAEAQKVTRGPYLQLGTPDSIVVVWRTDVATDSRVDYGSTPTALKTVSDAKQVTQHEVKITGLTPSTTYVYSVGTTAKILVGGDVSYAFRTPAAVGATQKFRAWILGDSGTGGQPQRDVREAMFKVTGPYARPQVFLHMGDIAYNSGTDGEFQTRFFDVYDTILRNTVCWPTLGNHEGTSSKSATQTGPYYDAYVLPKNAEAGGLASGTEAYYSFDYHNVHFIVLDSHDSPRTTAGAMLTWLKADLAATKQPWIIAYWHHPPYTKGSHDSDKESQLVEMRENALPILEAGGVDVVLAGHSHIYERSYLLNGAYATPTVSAGVIKDPGDGQLAGNGPYKKSPTVAANGGTVYVVAGHGGASLGSQGKKHPVMFFTEMEYGSCLLDVERNTLTLQNVRHDGKITDQFTMVKGDALIVTQPNGGETYSGGDNIEVRWATVGQIQQVKLDFSVDAGKNWIAITGTPVSNTGKYNWLVPSIKTNSALVRVTAADKANVSDESNVVFSILATTNGPTLAPIGDKTTQEEVQLTFTLAATHPQNVPLIYGAVGLPAGASLDPGKGTFSWTPTRGQAGTYPMVFTVRDDTGRSAAEAMTITVLPATTPPRDGGVTNADFRLAADGGTVNPPQDKGCGCTTASGGVGLVLVLLALAPLALVRRRRRNS